MFYDKELAAIERAGRMRRRRIFDRSLKDFASNDYLGLAHKRELLERAFERVAAYGVNAAKASQLINGYTPIHQAFEEDLCRLNGFEAAITVGSGFLANIALIEALVRRGDRLLMDEEFHASGILASRLVPGSVEFFAHNDARDLAAKLRKGKGRTIVAVEGIYSMSGDLLNPEIFDVIDEETILIVDEAHSSGVVGPNLLGVFDLYGIAIAPNHIKMGTMGKALGSYGAYILASHEIVTFLENRAKSIIYTTALSLMDVALAHEGLRYIEAHKEQLHAQIRRRLVIMREMGFAGETLILDIPKGDVLAVQERLLDLGYIVGAIRPPTVKEPMLRIIARLGESEEDLQALLERVRYV